MKDLKDNILQQAYNYYVNSSDFNGCTLYNISCKCTKEELYQCLTELISENKIDILSDKVNPHIKLYEVESVEKQIKQLPSLSYSEFCIYPSKSLLEQKRDVSCYDDRPFTKMLALGEPQLGCRFFNIDILHQYAIDPRYDYQFRDYIGSIYTHKKVENSEDIYLRTFGIGRNGTDYVIAVFLRDLSLMPAIAQNKWYSKMIADGSNCKVLENFIKNELLGNWYFPRTVFRAIIEEIENLYLLTKHIWGVSMFSEYYHEDDNKLRNFEMLLLPTNKNLDEFYQQLEIITVENLNKSFFELPDFGLEVSSYIKDGECYIKRSKGTLQLLKEWLSIIKPECIKEIHGVLNGVRTERSKGGAHNLLELKYSKEYYTEQFDLSKKVFNALNILRRIIQTHPLAKGEKIPYESNDYIEL